MNIHTQLNELTQEALGFSDVIRYTDNPVDADFCNACRLFSDYLSHQLESLDRQLNINNASESTLSITDQLHKLNSLITPEQIDPDNTAPWTSKLDSYCQQLETLRQIAA
ncbi:MAG TPA: hypothetical protein VIQ81_03655 [Gammaproteobacteria bacterium]